MTSSREFEPVVQACQRVLNEADLQRLDLLSARRVFHGRGHLYPGLEHLVVNWYPPYLMLAVFHAVEDQSMQALGEELRTLFARKGLPLEGIALQTRDGRRTATHILWGDVPEEHIALEDGLKFKISPLKNQNVGLFLDMSHVRQHIAQFMQNANVLNLFAYTCAFSVSAVHWGARQVVNNDMSSNALKVGAENHELNGHDLRKVRMLPHNLFKSWWKIKQFGPYDVIIIDPPTNQRGSFVAEKSYGQVLKRLPDLACPGARIIACLNSPFLGPEFLTQQMQRWCPACELIGFLSSHPDFPDRFPERGLKVAEFVYRG
ncbi:MAG: class I SAM-dependent methyltransferase [Pseudomonadota bacterium]